VCVSGISGFIILFECNFTAQSEDLLKFK